MEKMIEKIIRGVKVADLKEVIPHAFGVIDWEEVEETINRLHLSFKSKDIAAVCVELIRNLELPKEDLQRIHSALKLFEVTLSNTQTWKCFYLKQRLVETPTSIEDLKEAITKAYRSQALSVEITTISQDSNLLFMIQERVAMKKKSTLSRPMYYAFRPGLPYVLFSPHTISRNHIELITKALGYEECRSYSLEGTNVNSLISMLIKKVQLSKNYQIPDYEPALVEEKERVCYFNQSGDRKRYADEIFKGDITLTEFNVEATSVWRAEDIIPEMEDEEISTRLTFSGTKNFTVEDIFRRLVEDDHVTMPLPTFISQFPVLAKSQVHLTKNQDHLKPS